MFRRLLTYGKYGKHFAAIEHSTIGKEDLLNILVLKKKKKEFIIESSFQTDTIDALSAKLPNKQHLFLVINTNKVIFRSLEGSFDENKLITSAFPNLKIDDFYYEIFKTDLRSFIAICRKENVHSILEIYNKMQFNVVGFSLGPLAGTQLEGLVNEIRIPMSNGMIHLKEDLIFDIQMMEVTSVDYDVNGLKISNSFVLPLAGILAYFGNHIKTTSNFSTVINQLVKNFQQRRIFNFGLKICLATIFTLLLFSFLLFTRYTSKIDELSASLDFNRTQKNLFLKLSDQVDKKEKILQDFSLTTSKVSWYLDQIGISIPPSITFSKIHFQPLQKAIKEEQAILFRENFFVISGNSLNNSEFSTWIASLEHKEWIEKITISKYGSGKNTNSEFELQLEITE